VFFHTHFADPNQTFHCIKNHDGGLLQVVPFDASAVSIDNRISKAVLAPIASRSPANARIG
jgi:hypothetical protein